MYYLIKKCFVVLCSLILFIGLYSSEIHADTPEQTEQYRYALGLIQRKLYDEAAKVLTRLTSDPEQFSLMDAAVFWLAECEYRKGDYVKAAGYYKKLIKEFPGSEYYDRSAYGLGWSHTKDNNPKSAVEAFLSVTKKEISLWTDAKLKAGYLMVKYSMDTEKMIENYEDLLKENSLKPLQLYESNLQIAVGRFNQAIYKKALEFFNSALKHAPKDKVQAVQFYIAECQFRLKEYKLAASDYSKTMAIDPKSVLGQKSAYSLAWCNINNGESDKAISLFKNQVLETESVVRKESLKNLIELFMNTHDYQSAVEWADKYAQ
ncbi:MAG: tetratricopeptide repeat protein, partial [Candidatus Riflebacteria bacterium]